MNKKVKAITGILMLFFGVVFLVSIVIVIKTVLEYRGIDELYGDLAAEFIIADESSGERDEADTVPITVDFEELQKVNEDIVGWIYCEGTQINYPVLQGTDNDFYLNHTYDKAAGRAGSIFVNAQNRPGFVDSNTIIYGHHMKNGSMFAGLEDWGSQEYYEEHPVFWLLTPEKNYRILLISGYTTAGDSDTYTIFQGPCQEFEEYLKEACAVSDFSTDMTWDANGKFVVLSTCSYVFDDARYVVHGMLVEE